MHTDRHLFFGIATCRKRPRRAVRPPPPPAPRTENKKPAEHDQPVAPLAPHRFRRPDVSDSSLPRIKPRTPRTTSMATMQYGGYARPGQQANVIHITVSRTSGDRRHLSRQAACCHSNMSSVARGMHRLYPARSPGASPRHPQPKGVRTSNRADARTHSSRRPPCTRRPLTRAAR